MTMSTPVQSLGKETGGSKIPAPPSARVPLLSPLLHEGRSSSSKIPRNASDACRRVDHLAGKTPLQHVTPEPARPEPARNPSQGPTPESKSSTPSLHDKASFHTPLGRGGPPVSALTDPARTSVHSLRGPERRPEAADIRSVRQRSALTPDPIRAGRHSATTPPSSNPTQQNPRSSTNGLTSNAESPVIGGMARSVSGTQQLPSASKGSKPTVVVHETRASLYRRSASVDKMSRHESQSQSLPYSSYLKPVDCMRKSDGKSQGTTSSHRSASASVGLGVNKLAPAAAQTPGQQPEAISQTKSRPVSATRAGSTALSDTHTLEAIPEKLPKKCCAFTPHRTLSPAPLLLRRESGPTSRAASAEKPVQSSGRPRSATTLLRSSPGPGMSTAHSITESQCPGASPPAASRSMTAGAGLSPQPKQGRDAQGAAKQKACSIPQGGANSTTLEPASTNKTAKLNAASPPPPLKSNQVVPKLHFTPPKREGLPSFSPRPDGSLQPPPESASSVMASDRGRDKSATAQLEAQSGNLEQAFGQVDICQQTAKLSQAMGQAVTTGGHGGEPPVVNDHSSPTAPIPKLEGKLLKTQPSTSVEPGTKAAAKSIVVPKLNMAFRQTKETHAQDPASQTTQKHTMPAQMNLDQPSSGAQVFSQSSESPPRLRTMSAGEVQQDESPMMPLPVRVASLNPMLSPQAAKTPSHRLTPTLTSGSPVTPNLNLAPIASQEQVAPRSNGSTAARAVPKLNFSALRQHSPCEQPSPQLPSPSVGSLSSCSSLDLDDSAMPSQAGMDEVTGMDQREKPSASQEASASAAEQTREHFYFYSKVDPQEERETLGVIDTLPGKASTQMKRIYTEMVTARQNCEAIAFRGHRLLDQLNGHLQACLSEASQRNQELTHEALHYKQIAEDAQRKAEESQKELKLLRSIVSSQSQSLVGALTGHVPPGSKEDRVRDPGEGYVGWKGMNVGPLLNEERGDVVLRTTASASSTTSWPDVERERPYIRDTDSSYGKGGLGAGETTSKTQVMRDVATVSVNTQYKKVPGDQCSAVSWTQADHMSAFKRVGDAFDDDDNLDDTIGHDKARKQIKGNGGITGSVKSVLQHRCSDLSNQQPDDTLDTHAVKY